MTTLQGRILFDPTWGVYDLAVGSNINSVYGGVADRETLQLYKPTSVTDTIQTAEDDVLLGHYAFVNKLRKLAKPVEDQAILKQLEIALASYPQEWLLRVEMLTVAAPPLRNQLKRELTSLGQSNSSLQHLTALAVDSK